MSAYPIVLISLLVGAQALLMEANDGQLEYEDDPSFPEDNEDGGIESNNDVNASIRLGSNRRGQMWPFPSYLCQKDERWSEGQPCFGPVFESGWENRLLVLPEQKFAFCWIGKNAGTQFNFLMNSIVGKYAAHPHFVTSWFFNKSMSFNEINKKNGWKTAIFVRDPAERFLSAWRSKCVQWEDQGRHCLGGRAKVAPEEAVKKFEHAVKHDLKEYMRLSDKYGHFNSHFDPQSKFCGRQSLDSYDFVGRLTGDHKNVQSQVNDMLANYANIKPSSKAWEELRRVFPTASSAGHQTGSVSAMDTFYRDPAVYKAVVHAYSADYKDFKIPFHPSEKLMGKRRRN